jgi:hypothetical protein
MVSKKFKWDINWKKVSKNEKPKKKKKCYNSSIKGHFVRDYHKKEDWKNKFKGSSHVVTRGGYRCFKKDVIYIGRNHSILNYRL